MFRKRSNRNPVWIVQVATASFFLPTQEKREYLGMCVVAPVLPEGKVVDKSDPCTTDRQPDIAAAHQAGRVLVAHLLGLNPRHAEIFADRGIIYLWSGGVVYEPLGAPGERLTRDQAIGKVMLLLAGWIGEQMIGGDARAHIGDGLRSKAIDLVESIDGYTGCTSDHWLKAIVRVNWLVVRYLQDEGRELQRMLICKRRLEREDIGSVLKEHQVWGVEVVGPLVRLLAGGLR